MAVLESLKIDLGTEMPDFTLKDPDGREYRGRDLYGRPDHDSELFNKTVGAIPLAGFFCGGEIGPVNGTTYLHTFTSSFAIFRPGPPSAQPSQD